MLPIFFTGEAFVFLRPSDLGFRCLAAQSHLEIEFRWMSRQNNEKKCSARSRNPFSSQLFFLHNFHTSINPSVMLKTALWLFGLILENWPWNLYDRDSLILRVRFIRGPAMNFHCIPLFHWSQSSCEWLQIDQIIYSTLSKYGTIPWGSRDLPCHKGRDFIATDDSQF